MALHTEDMSQVAAPGELVDEGSYLGRIAEVRETDADGNPLLSNEGQPKVVFMVKIQDEGKAFGRSIPFHASLQPHALMTLKAIYEACGYKPGPEGHDPQQVLDGEFYFTVTHQKRKDTGELTQNVAPWTIRSVSAGPHVARSK